MTFSANAQSLRLQTHLGNWREAPQNRWAFHNVRQLVPSAPVFAGGTTWKLGRRAGDLSRTVCTDRRGNTRSFDEVLSVSSTDAVLVMHQGQIIEERYFNGMQPRDPHILMSVSKSVTGAIAGVLTDQGLLDPDVNLTTYMPELIGTGYVGATAQDLLDMRVGLAFDEDYYVTEGVMIEYREATGWNPISDATPPGGLHDFLLRRSSDRGHGGDFQYTSPNSDLLGWLLERLTGKSLATLITELLWEPMGAEFDAYVTVDRFGAARAAGGINMTLRDLARLGQTMLQQGMANDTSVLPAWWVHDTTTGGDPQAWANGNFAYLLPDGCYRNKWYQYGNDLGAYCAIGIHGQFLYVAPQAGVVIAHFASHPEPFDAASEVVALDAYDTIARTFVT